MADLKNLSPIGESWDVYRDTHFTEEEKAESDLMVEIIGEVIKARKESHMSQRDLEAVSGIRQPAIARLERGGTDPKLSTIIKILSSLNMKLAVVPLKK